MSEADDRARLRYLQLKAKAAAAEQAAPVEPPAQPQAEPPGKTEAALRGAGQGFPFGQGANINGLIQALGERYLPEANPKLFGVEIPVGGGAGPAAQRSSLAEAFARNKGTFQRENDAASEAHPWLYGGANGLATLATLVLGGGARAAGATTDAAQLATRYGGPIADAVAAAARGTNVAPKAASLASLLLRGGRSGLMWGGASGVGNGLGDLLQGNYGRFAGDVATSAIPGMFLGGALGPVPALLGRAAGPLQNFAYRQAVKAAGPLKRDTLALLGSGRLESVGKKLMEMGLVPSGAAVEGIAGRVGDAAETRGADVHSILGELDALQAPAVAKTAAPRAVAQTPTGLTQLPPALEGRPIGDFPGRQDLIQSTGTVNQRVPGLAPAADELPGFNPVQVAARARAELLNPLRDQPALKHLAPGLEDQIQNLEDLGNRRLTFQHANDIKRGYDKLLDWDKEQTPAKELLKQLRGLVNDEIEKHADAAATQAGDPDLAGRFMSAKQDYRDLRQVADFAQKSVAGREANGFFSLPDYIAGAAPAVGALASGHPLTALGSMAGAFGSKLLRERGNSVAANLALGLGQHLAIPGNLTDLGARGLTSWTARSQGQRALYGLLGGANLSSQGAEPALMGAP